LRVAADLLDAFADGVWWIELAPLTDPALIAPIIAATVDLRAEPGHPLLEALTDYLRVRQILLILDNCEHLIEACAPLIQSLLQSCPELYVLATSREVLNVGGELPYHVPPLAFPQPGEVLPFESLAQYEAVRLFVERAAAALPGFAITDRNGAAVAQICYRLDGMPLAIELAATRVQLLRVDQIAARLDDRFRLLTDGKRTALLRHQTLRAAIDWSHDLLSDDECRVLRRLSVFAGGWTLEAAEAVCADQVGADDVLDVLTALVNKSLVIVERRQGRETRYRLLETIRQYANEKLHASGELAVIHHRHLDYFLRLAEEVEPKLQGAEQASWIEKMNIETGNLRAALEWSFHGGSAETGLQLGRTLGLFWFMRGHLFDEGIEWLQKALSLTETSEQMAARATVYRWLGLFTYLQGDNVAARTAYEQSLALFRQLGDKDGIAESLLYLGDIAAFQGDAVAAHSCRAAARPCYEESLVGLREQNDQWKIAHTLNLLGEMARAEDDYDAARSFYEESLAIRRELGDVRGIGASLHNLTYVANYQGDYQRAAMFFEESLALFQKLGSKQGILCSLEVLAGVIKGIGQPERAARLMGAVEALYKAFHIRLNYVDQVEHDRYVAAARAQLDEATFAAAWAEGQAMTMEEAIAYALVGSKFSSSTEQPAPATAALRAAKQRFGGLTAREREVAVLVAQGKSNRDIAEMLVIELKTVEAHVTRILNKLGFDNRVQIATWVVNKGLMPSS
jgi:predicted ATPase/DNA-binding CsgD family transcriptional regulator